MVNDYDGVFITWSIDWASYALFHQPWKLFEAPIFFPLQKTLTFSDPMITAAMLATPFLWITREPLVAHSAVIFISYVMMGWFTCLFVFQATQSRFLAITSGLYATFGAYHTMYMGHLHTFMIQWIPLSLYAWLKYKETLNLQWMWLLSLSWVCVSVNAPFTGYLLLASQGIWIFDTQSHQLLRTHWKKLLVPLGVGALFIGVCYLPYLEAFRLYHAARTLRDAAHFALSLDEIAFSPRGILTSIWVCLGIGLVFAFWKRRAPYPKLAFGAFGIAFFALIMALGPVLKWQGKTVKIPFPIPLPYSLVYALVPGMQAFRVPARWIVLTSFFVLIGTTMLATSKSQRTFLGGVFLVLLFIENPWIYPTYTLHTRQERQPVYQWLETHVFEPVAFMPPEIYAMPQGAKKEVLRMLDLLPQTRVIPMYNGYSGYAPQERIDALVTLANTFPSKESMSILNSAGIHTIVIEKSAYQESKLNAIRCMLHMTYEDDYAIIGTISDSN